MNGQEERVDGYGKWGPAVDILAILGVYILATMLVGMLVGMLIFSESVSKEFGMLLGSVLGIAIAIFFAVWLQKRRTGQYPKLSFSLRKANPALILWGVVLITAVSTVLEPLLMLFPEQWMTPLKDFVGDGRNVWVALNLVVAAPVFEEILFRGLIQTAAVRSYGPWRGILLAAAVFGVAHLIPQQAINAFFLATIIGYVYYKTGSLASVIAIHAANNLIAYLFILSGHGDSMLSDVITNKAVYWTIYVACVLVAGYSIYRLYREIKATSGTEESTSGV